MLENNNKLVKWLENWISKNSNQIKQVNSYADILELSERISSNYLKNNITENNINVLYKIEYLLCDKYSIKNIIKDIYEFTNKYINKTKEEICELYLINLDKKFSNNFWKGNREEFRDIVDKRVQWVLWYLNWK